MAEARLKGCDTGGTLDSRGRSVGSGSAVIGGSALGSGVGNISGPPAFMFGLVISQNGACLVCRRAGGWDVHGTGGWQKARWIERPHSGPRVMHFVIKVPPPCYQYTSDGGRPKA